MSDEAAGAIPECLETVICPNCAYSLEGLGECATCPECGREYDESEIVLYGWGRGQKENIATAKGSRLFWVFILSLFWLAFQIPHFVFGFHNLIWFILCVGIVVAINMAGILRRSEVDHPGKIQIRLNADGCVQFGSLNGPSFILEFISVYAWLLAVCIALGFVVAKMLGWKDFLQFWIWFPLATIAAIVLWTPCRRFRKKISQMPDNAIADRNLLFWKRCSWRKVKDVMLGSANNGKTFRLRFKRGNWILTDYPVDAEIQCTREQADSLRLWIEDRLRAGAPANRKLR